MAVVDKGERRQVLLRAARDVFATKGFHDAKVDDITVLAGVAKGTFYLYFPDKRSVFEALVDGLFARLGGAILHVEVSDDVETQVKHNIRAVIAVLLDDPALTQILLSYGGLDPLFVEKIQSFYTSVREMLRLSLVEGQRLGIVAPGDTGMYATFTLGALKELLHETVQAKVPRHREELVAGLYAMLQGGYLRVIPGVRVPEPLEAAPVSLSSSRLRRRVRRTSG
jgi:AcrR family transcriptional regulator